jgi:arsenate reductase
MKILFVCRGNVGRSQMAAAFYNKFSGSNDADSAGTHVEAPGQTLLERKNKLKGQSFVIDAMNGAGIDVSQAVRTQLDKDMLEKYDVVIYMSAKRYTPKWLSEASNAIYWKVTDPNGRNLKVTVTARDIIKQKVTELLKHRSS